VQVPRRPRVGDDAILIGGVIQCERGLRVKVLGRQGAQWMVQIIGRDNYAFRVVSEYDIEIIRELRLTSWPPDPETFDS